MYKKNLIVGIIKSYTLRKICLIICFLLGAMGSANAIPNSNTGQIEVSTQDQNNFTVKVKNMSIFDVFNYLKRNTEYVFIYNNDIVDLQRKVDIEIVDQPMEKILNKAFEGTNLSYVINDRQVIIKEEKAKSTTSSSAKQVSNQGKKIQVKGVVLDEAKEPMTGVIVREKDTNNGTLTDIDGVFSITVVEGATIVLSHLGFLSTEIKVSNDSPLSIVLKEDMQMMDEVVVVGYGTQKKVNLSGAISQVSSKDLANRPVNTVSQMLQGTMPNVNVKIGSGAPGEGGSISIRGVGSVNGGEPLVLIDGIPGDLNRLNPADIEAVSVLKDASAAAVYGARGAFGVVLVTTKSPSTTLSKTVITYDGYVSFSQPTVSTDFLTSGYDHTMLNDEAMMHATGKTYTGYSDADMEALLARRYDKTEHPDRPWVVVAPYKGKDIYNYYGNWDWWSYFNKDWMPAQSHSVNVSGGSDKVSYMLSASYYAKDGLLKKNTEKFESFTINTKLIAKLTSWAKLTNTIQYYDSKYTSPGREGRSNENWQNINVHGMAAYAPVNPDGTFSYNTAKNSYSIADGHAASLLSDVAKNKLGAHELRETIGLEFDIIKGLKFKADYTFQFYLKDDWYRRGKEYYSVEPGKLQEIANLNTDYYVKTMRYDPMHVANAFFSYNKSIKDHNFGLTGGINYENQKSHSLKGTKFDIISSTLNDLNLGSGEARANGGQYEYELFGAFYRANYDYKQRYLLEVSGRYDGTSRYKSDKRYGFFPSLSGAWRLSEESWFLPVRSFVDNFKLRLSYGTLGNQLSDKKGGYYPYIESMTAELSNWLINNGKTYQVNIPTPVRQDLTWEKASTINFGLDFNVLRNRLSFTGDIYIRDTKDMLVPGVTLPGVFGAASPRQNAGDLRTKGFEIGIVWNDQFNLANKPFHYGASFGIGDATTEITKFSGNDKGLISEHYKGKKWGEIWGYRTDGLFQSDQEATEWNAIHNQRYVNSRIYKAPGEWGKPRAGDVKFLNLDDNPAINPGSSTISDSGDMEVIGNTTPRYNYSFGANASWNGIDVSAFFQGVIKQDFYPGTNMDRFWGPYSRPYYTYIPKDFAKDVWSEDNKDAYFPQLRTYTALDGNSQLSVKNDRYLQNIGYLRFKNLVVGYTLPQSLTRKAKIEKVRIYGSGENLMVWSPFRRKDYIDPEQAAANDNGRIYPLSRTFSVGLNVVF